METATPRSIYDGGPGGFKISFNGSAFVFTSSVGLITGAAITLNTNYHIAVTRSGGSTRLFRDGVQEAGTISDTANYTVSSGYPRIGGI